MHTQTYTINNEYIELYKLLKITRLADTGGMAKMMIEDGAVTVNDRVDRRKRAKIKKGDRVVCQDHQITVV